MEFKKLLHLPVCLTLLVLCCLGCFAVAARAEGSTVDALVTQGTTLAEMDEPQMKALLVKIEAAKADATSDELVSLKNLEASVNYSLSVLSAAENGTMDELEQNGVENSWRYQNGSLVAEDIIESDDLSLSTFAVPANTHMGIDVSRHNGTIDWNAVKAAGIEFAILRCGIGNEYDGDGPNNQDDPQWERNVSECERLGIPYGVYLYSYATNTDMAANEARHTLNLLSGHSPQLPVFYDVEDNCHANLSANALGAMAQVWCDAVQGAGYKVGIYTYQEFWKNKLTAGNFNNGSWYRWVACYISLNYAGRMDAWQFSSNGSVNGINGRVDMNYWYGDLPTNIVATPAPTATPRPSISEQAASAFATRLYKQCLNREPEPAGLAYWVNELKTGGASGGEVAYRFVFSDEFKGKNYCNTDFIKTLYRTFLAREYDQGGLDYWLTQLARGSKREDVFNNFVISDEFRALCAANGIYAGTTMPVPEIGTYSNGKCEACGAEDGITAFVTRLYKTCLDREPESAGLAYWCNNLRTRTFTGRATAHGFVFSDEFTYKRYDNAKFVEYLYEGLMGRSSDATGKAYWLARMAAGESREAVFNGFADSAEFTAMCGRYGITRG